MAMIRAGIARQIRPGKQNSGLRAIFLLRHPTLRRALRDVPAVLGTSCVHRSKLHVDDRKFGLVPERSHPV